MLWPIFAMVTRLFGHAELWPTINQHVRIIRFNAQVIITVPIDPSVNAVGRSATGLADQ
jgi:hypothetical protein